MIDDIVPGDIYIPNVAVIAEITGFNSLGYPKLGEGIHKGEPHKFGRAVLVKRLEGGKLLALFKNVVEEMKAYDTLITPGDCDPMKALEFAVGSVYGVPLHLYSNYFKRLRTPRDNEPAPEFPSLQTSSIDSIDVVFSLRGNYTSIDFNTKIFEQAQKVLYRF